LVLIDKANLYFITVGEKSGDRGNELMVVPEAGCKHCILILGKLERCENKLVK